MANTTQFNRKLELILYPNDNTKDTLDLGQFRITFNTVNDDRENPNHANVRVYNLSVDLVKSIIKQEFSYLQINAGYETNSGTIFLGTVRYARSGRDDNADSYVDILAYDWDLWYSFGQINKSYAAGSTPQDIFKAIVRDSRVPIPEDKTQLALQTNTILNQAVQSVVSFYDMKQLDAVSNNPYLRGKVCMDMSRDCLRRMASSYGFNWSIQKGKLLLIPKQGVLNVVNEIDNTTGLIGFPELQLDGIHLKTLLNPNIIIGSIIKLNKSVITGRAPNASLPVGTGLVNDALTPTLDGAGQYRVISVTYSGDTRGQEWYSNIIGIALDNVANSINFLSEALQTRVGGILDNYQNVEAQ